MVTRRSLWKLALTVICVMLAGTLLACEPQDSGPKAWIDEPVDGASFPAGEPVKITFHAYARDGVAEVLLSVNGEPLKHGVLDEPEAPFSKGTDEWVPTEAGDYRLQVRTFDVNGESSLPAAVNVRVVKKVTLQLRVTPAALVAPTSEALIKPTESPKPVDVLVIPTDTPTTAPAPAYDLYVRRMDFTPSYLVEGETIQMAIMLATDTAPQGAPYFPASHFRWRQGPGFPWQEEACPDNTEYASCVKNLTFSYAQQGSYVVEVEADSRQAIPETDETNNVRSETITIYQFERAVEAAPMPGYDLYVRQMDFLQTNPAVGDTIQLSIMLATDVAPQGAPYFPASFFQWRQGPNFPWQEEACPQNAQYASCVKNVTFSYAQPGSYVVAVEADHRQAIPEADETNNTRSWTINVGQAQLPDVPPPPKELPVPSDAEINLRADRTSLESGQCTTLRWDVENATGVYLNGEGVVGHGTKEVCPDTTKTYTLHVEAPQRGGDRQVTIQVSGPPAQADTSPPPVPSPTEPGNGSSVKCSKATPLKWSAVKDASGIAGYYIKMEHEWQTGSWSQVWEWGPSNNTEIGAPVDCGGQYRWKVRAKDNAGNESGWSGWSTFKVQ